MPAYCSTFGSGTQTTLQSSKVSNVDLGTRNQVPPGWRLNVLSTTLSCVVWRKPQRNIFLVLSPAKCIRKAEMLITNLFLMTGIVTWFVQFSALTNHVMKKSPGYRCRATEPRQQCVSSAHVGRGERRKFFRDKLQLASHNCRCRCTPAAPAYFTQPGVDETRSRSTVKALCLCWRLNSFTLSKHRLLCPGTLLTRFLLLHLFSWMHNIISIHTIRG